MVWYFYDFSMIYYEFYKFISETKLTYTVRKLKGQRPPNRPTTGAARRTSARGKGAAAQVDGRMRGPQEAGGPHKHAAQTGGGLQSSASRPAHGARARRRHICEKAPDIT